MNAFNEVISSPVLRRNLAAGKFVTPTPVQAQAIPPALEGKDIVATAQTGTGKTLAFTLPILQALTSKALVPGPQALILSPTRELALQIHEVFVEMAKGTGVKTAVVVGGMSEAAQLKSLRLGAQVVIATPGRLCDYLERNLTTLSAVKIAVLDEADRMLDMGFLPAVESILRKTSQQRQTMFFSATFESSAGRLVDRHCKSPVRIAVGSISKPAEQIEMHVYEVEADRKLALLLHLLKADEGSFLVFGRTKHGCERLAKKLNVAGLKVTAIHGDRSQSQRNQALAGFRDGQYRVLVATDVAARGIHVDNVSHVVNYDLPQQSEDYIHRVGRTGRAGAKGIATTFACSLEMRDIAAIEKSMKVPIIRQPLPAGLGKEIGAVVEIPVSKLVASRTRSFAPRRGWGRR